MIIMIIMMIIIIIVIMMMTMMIWSYNSGKVEIGGRQWRERTRNKQKYTDKISKVHKI